MNTSAGQCATRIAYTHGSGSPPYDLDNKGVVSGGGSPDRPLGGNFNFFICADFFIQGGRKTLAREVVLGRYGARSRGQHNTVAKNQNTSRKSNFNADCLYASLAKTGMSQPFPD